MDVIKDDILDAIETELCGANERFPLFASMHEAIAVIAEELDEATDALSHMRDIFDMAWRCVKSDNTFTAMECITRLKYEAENLAIEACQVAAMCEKAVQSAAEWKGNMEGNEKC